jgi:GMP synthase (glutamine-hydrolysing)
MQTQSDLYKQVLNSLAVDLECTIVCPADNDSILPRPDQLQDFDGIAWTGSSLNIYDRGSAIDRQIDFMKVCMGQDTRIFGSCWGLQVAVVAAGGDVAANTKGREIGIARNIQITVEGLAHPLYAGKSGTFDAVAVHLDHTIRLPEGTSVLSGNDLSEIQAIEIRRGGSVFWGVQYHPEFDLEYIAGIVRRYAETLIIEGICKDEVDVETWAGDLSAALRGENPGALRDQYGLGSDVVNPDCRLRELSNWLSYVRQEKANARAAA